MARPAKKLKSLSSGRAAVVKPRQAKFSAKKGRTIIRTHHQRSKALADAQRAGDVALVKQLELEIEQSGGLETYQQASLLGQSKDRGGDSSKVLLDWLKPKLKGHKEKVRVLEVGALSVDNACSRWEPMQVTRIDLNSQSAGILKQDFMERPLPAGAEDKFDVLSLSLVLNYVPSKEGRGEMLRRTCEFLDVTTIDEERYLPCLFLVLPAPCVENSRYMTEARLVDIMGSLGYSRAERKVTSKLVYSLWLYQPDSARPAEKYGKVEVNAGKARNNFCIVI